MAKQHCDQHVVLARSAHDNAYTTKTSSDVLCKIEDALPKYALYEQGAQSASTGQIAASSGKVLM